MSGKRQHFIPRFLQVGFASHSSNNETYTWVYRKESKPFKTNIKNVGVESQFYSQDRDSQIDATITSAENQYSDLVKSMRGLNENILIDSKAIGNLLAHLEVRTRHLRENFIRSSAFLLENVLATFDDHQAVNKKIERMLNDDPSILRDAAISGLNEHNISISALEEVLKSIDLRSLSQTIPSLTNRLLPDIVNRIRADTPKMLATAAKTGHIRALTKTLSPTLKANLYATMKYRLIKFQTETIPLGDSILVFLMEGERTYKPFCDKGDSIQAVFLPVASDCVLIGSTYDIEIDASDLKTAIAQCSLEYFICNTSCDENATLATLIGETSHLISKDEIKALLGGVTDA